MAARKPDAEVGPLGVWAYDTREELGLSAAQVAARAGVTEPTIRKVEGGSNRTPSKRLVRDMFDYFREIGERDGKPVEPPPGFLGELPAAATPDLDALIQTMTAQTAAITELVELVRPMAGPLAQQVADLQRIVQRLLYERGMPIGPGLPVLPDSEG